MSRLDTNGHQYLTGCNEICSVPRIKLPMVVQSVFHQEETLVQPISHHKMHAYSTHKATDDQLLVSWHRSEFFITFGLIFKAQKTD